MTLAHRFAPLFLAAFAAAQAQPTDAEFDAAVALARELALPEPPANAPFVLLQSNSMTYVDGVATRPLHRPAFRLPPVANGAPTALVGTTIESDRVRFASEQPDPAVLDAATIEANGPMDDFAREQNLAVAVQLWARGHRELARSLAARRADGTSLEQRVATLASSHWYAQCVESELPFAEIHLRLQKAVARVPEGARVASNNLRFPGPAWTTILDRVERAARTPPANADPETKLVLQLVESRRPGGAGLIANSDRAFDAVVRRGFAIVPALFAHLDDDRTTRAMFTGMNMAQSYVRPLGEIAADALRQLAGGEIPLKDSFSGRIERERAEAWWAVAKDRAEDDYYVERFLASASDFSLPGPLQVLVAKFPERLELALLELVAKHPEQCSHVVVDGLADSSMRKTKKVELLERIAAHEQTRLHALRRLAGIDEDRFCTVFVDVLRKAPTKTPKQVWLSPNANFGHLVVLTKRPEVWREFLLAARRAEIGLRMEYFGPFVYSYLDAKQRTERMACLAALLDDAEVYDVEGSGQTGPHAAFVHKRLAMRDFAAGLLAAMLGLGTRGGADWTEEQWARLRSDVREALAKAGVEPMQAGEGGGR